MFINPTAPVILDIKNSGINRTIYPTNHKRGFKSGSGCPVRNPGSEFVGISDCGCKEDHNISGLARFSQDLYGTRYGKGPITASNNPFRS